MPFGRHQQSKDRKRICPGSENGDGADHSAQPRSVRDPPKGSDCEFSGHKSIHATHRQTALPPRQTPHHPTTTNQLATCVSARHRTTSRARLAHAKGPLKRISSRTTGTGKLARMSSVPGSLVAVAVAGTVAVVGCAVWIILQSCGAVWPPRCTMCSLKSCWLS